MSGGMTRVEVSITAFLGVALSNVCHLLSVLLLYSLSMMFFLPPSQSRAIAAIAIAALHIISPAGAFLLSPCSEALFSFLEFQGFQLYLNGLRNRCQKRSVRADFESLAAGAVFGLATTVRSNGLLSGTLFLYDATVAAAPLINGNLSFENARRLVFVGIGGCLVALGTIIPQYIVYGRYCTLDPTYETRPWCNDRIPSIYAWVQGHYW